MSITFIDIERQKSWRIGVLFCVLVALYFIFALIVVQFMALLIPGILMKTGPFFVMSSPKYAASIALLAFFIAGVHFFTSGYTAVQRVIEQVGAKLPDPEDGIHRQLMNIVTEIQIASGHRRDIRCMVIPTLSTNALAVTDLKGEAVIAITEGLISRLTRPQIESVVAHEAYHVLSGDCLEASVATSLFGMYATAAEGLGSAAGEEPRAIPVMVLFWMLYKLSAMVSMFISREREYRADAGAVRMTRDPLALAGALDIISRRWSGTGLISDGLEMLCISSPRVSGHDESEGWWDDLMSTHPPIRKRIDILLGMAHTGASALADKAGKTAERLSEGGMLSGNIPIQGAEQGNLCPSCKQPLLKESYERTWIFQCSFCGGTLVDSDKLPRIIARSGDDCPERVKALASAVIADNQRKIALKMIKGVMPPTRSLLHCSKCGNPMLRTFYSLAYLIEVDKCGLCGVTWFDRGELEMLQCLIRNKITA